MIRRRLAVTAAVLAALVGEWLGHSLTYFRVAGFAGLQAGLSSGVHDYMVPMGLALLVVAAVGAAAWTNAWLALGRRLDRSVAALAQPRRRAPIGGPAPGAAAPGGVPRTPSFAARVVALAAALAVVQCSLYLVQENLERALHGLTSGGLAPLLDGDGAAVWIQTAIGLLLATLLVAAMRLLSAKRAVAERCERMLRVLWARVLRSASSPRPRLSDVIPTQLLLGNALWCRPPPLLAAV